MLRDRFPILTFVLSAALLTFAARAFAETAQVEPAPAPTASSAAATKGAATSEAAKPVESAKTIRPRDLPAFTQEREAAALTFVRTHHPELADLLEPLKKKNKPEYQRAIRDLFRQSERLAQAQERNPRRYDFELADWKLNSRIQILVAKLTMSDTPAVEEQLRQLIVEQMNLRKQQLVEERQRLASRVAEADEQLAKLEREQPQRVEQRLKELLSGTKKGLKNKSKE